MKILSCHIENYGALSNKDYDFSDGITCFMQENGTGKTTLASFIKAMFYGLPSYKTNSKTFDDRQHFYPFGGGKFGGNLTFEMDKTVYRIERFFDKKSGVKDETKVYKGGKEFTGFGDDIGKKIFGLDLASFERTVFVTSEEVSGSSWDINAKLNRDVSATDDTNFDSALKALEAKRKDIKADRGKGGLLDRAKDRRQELIEKIADLKLIERGLAASYERRAALQREVDGLNEKYKAESERKVLREKKNVYDGYIAELNGKRMRIRELENLPEQAVLEELNRECSEYSGNEVLIKSAEKELSAGEANARFEGIDEAKLQHIAGCIEKYRKADAALKAAVPVAAPPKKNTLLLVLAILAVVLIGAGICLTFVILYLGIALLAAGVLVLLADGFLYLKRRMDTQGVPNAGDMNLRSEMAEAETKARAFLAPLGYYSDSVIADYTAFAAAYENYKNSLADRAQTEGKIDGLRKRNDEIYDKVQAAILSCGQPKTDDICGAIADLIQKRRLLDGLKDEYAALEARAEKYKSDNNLDGIVIPEEEETDTYFELDLKRKQLVSCDNEISADESDVEQLPDRENEKETVEERIKLLEHRREIISLTEEYLAAAERNLKERYIAPIKGRFDYYADKIKSALGGKLKMDEDFSLSFESGGELRSEKHLSAGLKSVCGLCLRFALIDNMFKDEKPFIIMDDPFVNLDGVNMGGTAEILRELSKDMQIIYFTCHESREVR